jgi:hypothetical protein
MNRSNRSFLSLTIAVLPFLVACGTPGDASNGASDPPASDPAPATDVAAARAQAQRDLILGGGEGVQREVVETQVTPAGGATPAGGVAWVQLASLPAVATAYSFALSDNDVDNTARLGFMFTDPTYEATLQSEGVLWAGDGAYFGANAVALYALTGSGSSSVWTPYQGRYTPQTYSFSELRYDSGNSYYTTLYSSFGGLISAIENGGKGVYALTPAYTTARAHSIAFDSHVLYALAAQQTVGLTLSTTPSSSFGNLNDLWTNEATIEAASANATLPEMINANGTLVGAYIVGTEAKVRATTTPSTVTSASQFNLIGTFTGAAQIAVAYANGELYAAYLSSSGALTVKEATISNLSSVTWNTVTNHVSGTVTALALTGLGSQIALAVRVGTSVEVFTNVSDAAPSFTQVIAGSIALQSAAQGLVLSVCNLGGTNQVETFLQP